MGGQGAPQQGFPQHRPSVELLEMHLTLPPSGGLSAPFPGASLIPPHLAPVRKQVCAEPGPGPELGLSTPLVALRGRGWSGVGDLPCPHPLPRERSRSGFHLHLRLVLHFPGFQASWRSIIGNTAGLMYNIYKKGGASQPPHPVPGWPLGSLAPRNRGAVGPGLSFSQQWNVSYGPGLGSGESQPPQDW